MKERRNRYSPSRFGAKIAGITERITTKPVAKRRKLGPNRNGDPEIDRETTARSNDLRESPPLHDKSQQREITRESVANDRLSRYRTTVAIPVLDVIIFSRVT